MATPYKHLTDRELDYLGQYAVSLGYTLRKPSFIPTKQLPVPVVYFKSFGDVIVRLDRWRPEASYACAGSYQIHIYKKDKSNRFNPEPKKSNVCISSVTLDNLEKKFTR